MKTALVGLWKFLFGWLVSNQGTLRRLVATVLTAAALLLSSKLGIDITPEQVDALTVIIVTYILGSNAKEALQSLAKKSEPKPIASVEEALAEFSKPAGQK